MFFLPIIADVDKVRSRTHRSYRCPQSQSGGVLPGYPDPAALTAMPFQHNAESMNLPQKKNGSATVIGRRSRMALSEG
jgi:hypothetical protein